MPSLDYATWLECALAYARARGIPDQDLPEHPEQRRLHGEGWSPATYVERAFEGRLRKEAAP